jgi:low affinity Fe/Cu permease
MAKREMPARDDQRAWLSDVGSLSQCAKCETRRRRSPCNSGCRRRPLRRGLGSTTRRSGEACEALLLLRPLRAWRTGRDDWREGMSQGYGTGVSVKHPTERGSEGRTLFDRAAEAASNFSSSPTFFTVCGLLVAAWAASYLLGASDTLHHVLADGMAALTLMLVALLKNAERRAEHAIQGKLDRLAEAMLAEHREHPDDGAEKLEEAVGMHDEV